jgi:molecular chaperone DnaJ
MLLKDYYAILELQPPVTQVQIKKAYRRLAQLYHPDKSPADHYAHSRFADIKEAYEVLTDPFRREQYHHQRWYHSSTGRKTTSEITTPVSLLKHFLMLDKRLSHSDQFRMDKESLAAELHVLLDRENLAMLKSYHDESINQELANAVIRCMKFVPYASLPGLVSKLQEIVPEMKNGADLKHFMAIRKKALLWERLRIPLLLMAAALICILIFVVSK